MSLPARERGRDLAACAALVALPLVAYGRVAGNGFIDLDDNLYVTQNPLVH